MFQTLSHPDDTAALLVEPVLGEGGYVPGNERFFAGLRERADRHGILLVSTRCRPDGVAPGSSGAPTTSASGPTS